MYNCAISRNVIEWALQVVVDSSVGGWTKSMAEMKQNNGSENSDNNAPHLPEDHPENTPDANIESLDEENAQPRELTQTDHLNKSLLNSFLDRLNQPGSGFPIVQRLDTEASENNTVEDTNSSDEADYIVPEHWLMYKSLIVAWLLLLGCSVQ